jgi:tRNA-uridine 2-sulfurtransferase
MRKKVVIGLSGGVDSSVAAYLLKQAGHEVIGLFMINWHDTTGTLEGDCPWNDDLIFAELVARKLDIPFHKVDLSTYYRQRVVDYMFAEYARGRTPNPDVLCNREIKFDVFIDEAIRLGADMVATGHYCRVTETMVDNRPVYSLLAGVDPNKDQSYFLCQLSQAQLSKAMFPIGHLHKPEVREIATRMGLATATRKDSQGICFVGKVDLPLFLQQKLDKKPGRIVEIPGSLSRLQAYQSYPGPQIDNPSLRTSYTTALHYMPGDGFDTGEHQGAHFYTIGQRKGLNVGGKAKPLFVIDTDVERNIVYVGQGDDHPGLHRPGLFIPENEIHWIREDLTMQPGEKREYLVRVRYRQPLQPAILYKEKEGLSILFDTRQRGITPGQFAAWYNDDVLVGSGVIN